MSDKTINVEAILSKHGVAWETKIEGEESRLSADLSDTIAAIKEIVEKVIDKCAEEVYLTGFAAEFMQEGAYEAVDKDSILNVKNLVEYD